MVKRFIILALLAAGAWWYWAHWRPAHNYKVLGGQLESAVNEELARSGAQDSDVLQTVRREHTRGGMSWIETDRRLEVDAQQIPGLIDRLSRIAQTLGCAVLRHEETPQQTLLELGPATAPGFSNPTGILVVMQHLEFVLRGALAGLPVSKTPVAAIVIDDVAYDFPPMDHFAALGVPLTFAILPRDKNSKALAEKAVQMKFPVILHLPMEPIDLVHNNPGSAALYLKMTPEQLHAQFEKDVASVPHIQGINNHMGSAFTEDTAKMTLVLKWVKEKKLFFLDSHTSQRSVVPKVAKAVGIPCLINETFLDNEDSAESIEKQLDLVIQLALKRKQTIAIGHYRRKHLVEALAKKIPEFKAHGVTLVTLPSLYPKN